MNMISSSLKSEKGRENSLRQVQPGGGSVVRPARLVGNRRNFYMGIRIFMQALSKTRHKYGPFPFTNSTNTTSIKATYRHFGNASSINALSSSFALHQRMDGRLDLPPRNGWSLRKSTVLLIVKKY
jgi:hypothetical protein